jgi:hypothetical protein
MTKGKQITRLTPPTCEQIQAQMLEACHKIAEDHGLVIEAAGWHNVDIGFSFEPVFRVSIPAPDGGAINIEKDMFELLAERYGLSPADFGREFNAGGERFRVSGIDPRRPRYPISAERIPDRKGFKFTAENVVMFITLSKHKA